MKICHDCKHYIPTLGQGARCAKTKGEHQDFVYGTHKYDLCRVAREEPSACGMEAKWFEPVIPQTVIDKQII